MPTRKFQIHISEFCRRLYEQDQDEQVRREHSPDDFDLALLDEASIGSVANFLAKRIGMTFEDCWEYVVRAGRGCQWGKWKRANGEEWRDITHIARAMSDHFRGEDMEELVARFVEEAPRRAAEMGLTTVEQPTQPKYDDPTRAKSATRSWIQKDVDKAIRKYKAERASNYNDLCVAMKAGGKGAQKDARRLFGRNKIAGHLQCPKAMVSKSPAWRAIAKELDLEGRTPGARGGGRVGHDIGVEEASVEAYKNEEGQGADGENRAKIQELIAEQAADKRTHKIRQKP